MQLKKYVFSLFCLGMFLTSYATDIKITHGPYIQAISDNSVTIVWITNVDAVSKVELAPKGDDSFYSKVRQEYYQAPSGFKSIGKLHKVSITGLESNTEYRYRIFSKEVKGYEGKYILYGRSASTNVYAKLPLKFKTLDREADKINFSMVCDIHGRNDTLKALLSDVQYGKTDYVFFNGDMMNSVESEEDIFDAFMDTSISSFASETPMFYVRGNHETRGKFSHHFFDYFPSISGKYYYSFKNGPAYFIVLDSGEDKPDSDIEYLDLAQFDAYRSEQAAWLEQITQSEDFLQSQFKIVVIHIPAYGTDWHGAQDIRKKFIPILNDAKIDVMLCGHMHRFEYIKPVIGEHNFPIYLNDPNSILNVTVDSSQIKILRKSTKGKVLDTRILQ